MSEISEGEMVVTPNGRIVEHHDYILSTDNTPLTKNELVKLNDPIRVRVNCDRYAEYLVSLAEENGFEAVSEKETEIEIAMSVSVSGFKLIPDSKLYEASIDYDLTFVNDLPQIEAWLKYHDEGESEEECDTCGGSGKVLNHDFDGRPDWKYKTCPDCTDDSKHYDNPQWVEDYNDYLEEQETGDDSSKPRPEDEGYHEVSDYSRDEFLNILCHVLVHNAPEIPVGDGQEVPIVTAINELKRLYRKVDDLKRLRDLSRRKAVCLGRETLRWILDDRYEESELSECREELDEVRKERDEWRTKSKNWESDYFIKKEETKEAKYERDNLKERIEEARGYIKRLQTKYNDVVGKLVDPSSIYESIRTRLNNLDEILTPDSDEVESDG